MQTIYDQMEILRGQVLVLKELQQSRGWAQLVSSLNEASRNYRLTALRPGATLDSIIAANTAAAQLAMIDYCKKLPDTLIECAEFDLLELGRQLEQEKENEAIDNEV